MGKQTTEDFIRKAREHHGDFYDYSKSEYAGAHTLLTIGCPVHGEFKQRAGDHANVGKGCRLCGIRRGAPKARSTEEFVEAARKKHGHTYDYSGVAYKTHKLPVKIVCQEHGPFAQVAGKHLAGNGCPACRKGKITRKYKAKTRAERFEAWRENSMKLHANAYDYSRVDFVNSTTPVVIVCPEHGPFSQSPGNHLNNGCRCPECAREGKAEKKTKSRDAWLHGFRGVHGDKFDYSNAGAISQAVNSVSILCQTHGEFFQQAYVHLAGHGCPKCVGRVSSPEDALHEWLQDLLPGTRIDRNRRDVIPPYELDLYLPEKNTAIEFNGSYWHCDNQKDKFYHQRKSLLCRARGILLIHVYEYDWTTVPGRCLALLRGKLSAGRSKLNARDMTVRPVDDCAEFLEAHHFQGNIPASVKYGLYCQNELTAVMTFGKPRYSKAHSWEVLRFCSKGDVLVRGGAGKLFSKFKEENLERGGSVISYAQLDYSSGGVYEALGFDYAGVSAPGYVWVKSPHKVLGRQATQKHKLGNLLESEFNPSESESANMRRAGFKRIYNAGNLRYVYTNG